MGEKNHVFDDLPEGDGVLILSSGSEILSATLQTERLLRRRLDYGQILSLAEIFTDPYLPQAELALRETLQAGVRRANLLAQIRLKSDLVRFLKYSVAPLYGRDQQIIGAVLTFHDDTLTKAWSTWANFGLGVEPDAVFENFDRGLFVVNQRRRITAFNRLAREITGFSQEEVLGRY